MFFRLSRFAPTPSTYVAMPFWDAQSFAAVSASARVGLQLRDTGASGMPSVTSRMTTWRPGFWVFHELAYRHAPRMAAPVGVSPVGTAPWSDVFSAWALPGSAAIGTAACE